MRKLQDEAQRKWIIDQLSAGNAFYSTFSRGNPLRSRYVDKGPPNRQRDDNHKTRDDQQDRDSNNRAKSGHSDTS